MKYLREASNHLVSKIIKQKDYGEGAYKNNVRANRGSYINYYNQRPAYKIEMSTKEVDFKMSIVQ